MNLLAGNKDVLRRSPLLFTYTSSVLPKCKNGAWSCGRSIPALLIRNPPVEPRKVTTSKADSSRRQKNRQPPEVWTSRLKVTAWRERETAASRGVAGRRGIQSNVAHLHTELSTVISPALTP